MAYQYTVFDTAEMTERQMVSMEIVQLVSPIRKIRKASELFQVGSKRTVVGKRYVIVKPDVVPKEKTVDSKFAEWFTEEWNRSCARLGVHHE